MKETLSWPQYTTLSGPRRGEIRRFERVTEQEYNRLGRTKAVHVELQRSINAEISTNPELREAKNRGERERRAKDPSKSREACRRYRAKRKRKTAPKADTAPVSVGESVEQNTHKLQSEGKRERQKLIDAMLEIFTDPSVDLAELRSCWCWFPEGRKLVSEICALYSDPKEDQLKKTVLLSAILACLERLA